MVTTQGKKGDVRSKNNTRELTAITINYGMMREESQLERYKKGNNKKRRGAQRNGKETGR